MEYLIGFLIATAIGLTGVGAGIITAPVLMLVYHVPPAAAVGTALAFGVVTKFVIVPVYAARKQVAYGILARMLAGGLPGVLIGTAVLTRVNTAGHQGAISLALGVTIVVFAALGLLRVARPARGGGKDRPLLLAAVSFPIGAEVGFSSAGSGSLASLALMAWTKLPPAAVVGTDVCFGLGLSLVGGGILISGGHYDPVLLPKLLIGGIAGAIVAPNLAAYIPARALRVGLLLWIAFLGTQLVSKGLPH
jgi:hypothetical protein